MVLYRIILKDNLNMGRDRDETFVSLRGARNFINSLPQYMTTCYYQIRSNEVTPDRSFQTVERYTVWNNGNSNLFTI